MMSKEIQTHPHVSIIMGIYNCQNTLPEAIESILNQTFIDWHLIMCDDGSKDNTYIVAKNYADKYSDKITLIRNDENKGLNETLNHCLKYAKGKYVARMDGDDISLPTRLEKEVEFLEKHPEFAIVSTPMLFFDEDGDWGENSLIEEPKKKDLAFRSPVHCHAPCMIRREAYLAVDGYTVNPRMLRFEDVNLWFKLYAKGYRGYNLSEPLYKMRDDRDATVRRNLKSRINAIYVLLDGYKRLQLPIYMYGYIIIDLLKHIIKGIVPAGIYEKFHRRKLKTKK